MSKWNFFACFEAHSSKFSIVGDHIQPIGKICNHQDDQTTDATKNCSKQPKADNVYNACNHSDWVHVGIS